MIATSLTKDDLSQLQVYNTKIYPDKKIPAKNYLGFWFNRNGQAADQCLILQGEDGTIHGQILASEMSYYYKQTCIESVWLFDLIVDEELRKEGWGIDILLACMEKHPQSCSTGSGPTALPIHLKLGNSMLGELRKYVGITHLVWIATTICRGKVPISKFPKEVKSKGHTFTITDKQNLPELTNPFNSSMWEPTRDKSYLQWRFCNDLHDYAFYKDKQSDDYFVLRTIVQHRVTMMLLVDYRCDASGKEGFERIYCAVSNVMSKLHLAVLMTGSTLSAFDSVLERHHCKSIGRPRPVIGFIKVKDRKVDIENRNFAFVTLADSDGETNWI